MENEICTLCPRRCAVNRNAGFKGRCGETSELRIAAASIHRGEEPPVTGQGGSGTIFITGCNLGCPFCQNYQISQNGMGRPVGEEEFVRICLRLEERGAENINLVTGTHGALALLGGIRAARSVGLRIPILWNSSAYESRETLDLLADWIDGYLPDLKTLDGNLAGRLFYAADYPQYAEGAIRRMMELRPLTIRHGVLESGVIIRHLALPGYLDATREVLRWFAEHAQGRALLSLMTQYTPMTDSSQGHSTQESPGGIPNRYISPEEYERLLRWLEEFDIEDGFYQELVIDKDWLPDFNQLNPFSTHSPEAISLSTPLWHWKRGFLNGD